MKKTILKVLGYVGKYGGGIAAYAGLITLLNWVYDMLVDDKFAEEHSIICGAIWILGVVLCIVSAGLLVLYPLTWLKDWYDKKVDSIEDDFEK